MKQQFSSNYSFAIEPYKERLRLVVFKNNSEYVCRKENEKNLTAFLSGGDGPIFKGRLRLLKSKNKIVVQVKGEMIGEMMENDFRGLLPVPQH